MNQGKRQTYKSNFMNLFDLIYRLKRRNIRRGQKAITLPGLEPLATFRFVHAAKLEKDKYSVKERVNTTDNVITPLFPYQLVDNNTESVYFTSSEKVSMDVFD